MDVSYDLSSYYFYSIHSFNKLNYSFYLLITNIVVDRVGTMYIRKTLIDTIYLLFLSNLQIYISNY